MDQREMDAREARIREKAHELWVAEGRPEGRAQHHWDMAREMVATQENYGRTTTPVEKTLAPEVEPEEALANAGEFPTLTDRGEMEIPKR